MLRRGRLSQLLVLLQIIVLEDREAYMAVQTDRLRQTLQREPFGPLVICNPRLEPVGQKGFRYWEGCLSLAGYQVCIGHSTFSAISMHDQLQTT